MPPVISTLQVHRPFSILLGILISLSNVLGQNTLPEKTSLSGTLQKWHKITLSIEGPQAKETDAINPFTYYRLNVTFSQGNTSYVVPGYFAADGMAAESSADSGNVWRVHFAPDQTGTWNFSVSFRQGDDLALSDDQNAGMPLGSLDGLAGSFTVAASNKSGRDFRAKGRLRYVGERYLQFTETGEYFLKIGADAPENFLAYEDFDNTPNIGNRRKNWQPHVQDWKAGDPSWKNGKGKGIIGAINYLAEEEQNVFSFLTMNINGDDENVFPYISDNSSDRLRMDCSKLDQWEILFAHADSLGMYLHFKTQETENDQLLDGGDLGDERKLYYRELIARYGHHLALNWNIGEENTNTEGQRKAFAQYFYDHDPYRHHIVLHTYPNQQASVYNPLLGDASKYTGSSVQTNWNEVHDDTKKWVEDSEAAGKQWVVANDEQGGANTGVKPDGNGNNHSNIRKEVLWGNLMAGGAGVEYYFGYGFAHSDLTCEDFRSRDNMWDYNRYALQFFKNNAIPFWEMTPNDGLAAGNENWCLSKAGEQYIVYLNDGGSTTVNLGTDNATYEVKWFDPRNGGGLQNGSVQLLTASATANIGDPPSNTNSDWVALLTKTSSTNTPPTISISSAPTTGEVKIGDTVSFEATASDADGSIAKVVFYNGSTLLKEELIAPYTVEIPNIQAGTYTIYAVALDNQNAQTSSDTLSFFLQSTDGSCPALYKEENGLVVIEPERVPVEGDWELKTDIAGYTGAGYIRWNGNDQFNNPGQGLMEYTIQIQTPGTYRFNWRSRITLGNSNSEHNDSWLRFPNADDFFGEKNNGSKVYPKGSGKTPNPEGSSKDGWLKIYMNSQGEWRWIARTSDNDAHNIFVTFNNPGIYTMQISGRSKGHAIDRIIMYTEPVNANNAEALENLESLCAPSPNSPPTISFQSPQQNASFTEEDEIEIALTVSDPNLDPVTAYLYHQDTLLSEMSDSPYTFDWGTLPVGVYTLKAIAQDSANAYSDTAQVTFTVARVSLDTLNIVPDTIYVPFSAGDTTTTIESNLAWTFNTISDWIDLDPGSGNETGVVSISFLENPSLGERRGLAILDGGSKKDSLWIIQAGNPMGSLCEPPDSIWVTNSDQTSVSLSWNHVPGVTNYRIQYKEQGESTWQYVNEVADTTYTLEELMEESLYLWAIGADCNENQTLWSVPKSFQTEGFTLEPVSNLAPSFQSPIIYLVWEDMSNIEAGFIIERKTENGTYAPLDTLPANSSFFVDTFNIEPSITYTYRVITYHPTIDPGISVEVSITTNISTSLAPTTFSSVSIYPNPAREILFIENLKGKIRIQWLDIQGKLISQSEQNFTGTPSKHELTIPAHIHAGLYVILLSTERGEQMTQKVQIMK